MTIRFGIIQKLTSERNFLNRSWLNDRDRGSHSRRRGSCSSDRNIRKSQTHPKFASDQTNLGMSTKTSSFDKNCLLINVKHATSAPPSIRVTAECHLDGKTTSLETSLWRISFFFSAIVSSTVCPSASYNRNQQQFWCLRPRTSEKKNQKLQSQWNQPT